MAVDLIREGRGIGGVFLAPAGGGDGADAGDLHAGVADGFFQHLVGGLFEVNAGADAGTGKGTPSQSTTACELVVPMSTPAVSFSAFFQSIAS